MKLLKTLPVALGLAALPGLALAQEATPGVDASSDSIFIFNSLLFLIGGFLVMWMAAGFAMLESGLVRTKNTAAICLKNIALYSVAGLLFYLIGYNLMYVDVSGFMGSIGLFYNPSDAELALLGADEATPEMVTALSCWKRFSCWGCTVSSRLITVASGTRSPWPVRT